MAYFHCLIGGGSSGGGYELTVTCDADFAGTTITCTDGVTTLTQTCPSASPYEVVFEIPNGGEWTISGIISGQTYSTAIDIPDSLELHSVPEGSTVLPTDDIQTWLACAGIRDKSYTTLNEVLADSTTLLALISDNNASDYLVRSTTWASGITADSTAMTDIGANNYCANTLLADSTWRNAICDSTYFESVLNVKVPTMTSNTTPSGVASAFNVITNFPAYYAFDKIVDSGSGVHCWAGTGTSGWLAYQFPTPVRIAKLVLTQRTESGAGQNQNVKTATVQYSDTGNSNDWHDDSEGVQNYAQAVPNTKYVGETGTHKYWRINVLTIYNNSANAVAILELQFYGRVDV